MYISTPTRISHLRNNIGSALSLNIFTFNLTSCTSSSAPIVVNAAPPTGTFRTLLLNFAQKRPVRIRLGLARYNRPGDGLLGLPLLVLSCLYTGGRGAFVTLILSNFVTRCHKPIAFSLVVVVVVE